MNDIDWDSGWTTVSDKDSTPPYHARLVWVPHLLRQQLVDYARHLSKVCAFLDLVYQTRPSPEQVSGFFLTTHGDLDSIRPSTVQDHLKQYLDMPANSHRRYLRTELVQRGMDVESVDALMGHWSAGEEPWGRFSSFNFKTHQAVLQRFLVPLLDELGFTLISSSPRHAKS